MSTAIDVSDGEVWMAGGLCLLAPAPLLGLHRHGGAAGSRPVSWLWLSGLRPPAMLL
jgi:hypothetical protein